MEENFKKYFFMSIMFCSFFLILIVGFTLVERNAQSIITGENLSFLSYKVNNKKVEFLKIHFMGKDFTFNFS